MVNRIKYGIVALGLFAWVFFPDLIPGPIDDVVAGIAGAIELYRTFKPS